MNNYIQNSVNIKQNLTEIKNDILEKSERMKKEIYKANLRNLELKKNIDLMNLELDISRNIFSPNASNQQEKIDQLFQQIVVNSKELIEIKEKQKKINDQCEILESTISYITMLERKLEDRPLLSKINNTQLPILENDKELGLQLLQTQENERKRIARDLHDSTVQSLTNLIHKTELCNKLIYSDCTRAKLELETMTSTIQTIVDDMRRIIYGLRPMALDDLGLVMAIQQFIFELSNKLDIKFNFRIINEQKELIPIVKMTVFRIIQEACNNVIKHSKATEVEVSLGYYKSHIEVIIEDNGVGFEIEENKDNNHFGISIMKERIYLLQGIINIQSVVDKGTILKVNIPIKNILEEKENVN